MREISAEKDEKQNPEKKHMLIITSDRANRTRVVLDGVDLSSVITEIKFIKKSGNGKPPLVEIGLVGCDVSLEYPMVPKLPEIMRQFYGPLQPASRRRPDENRLPGS